MISEQKILHYIWLTLCAGVGTARCTKVFEHFGRDVTAAYKARLNSYLDIEGLSQKDAQLFGDKDLTQAKRIVELCRNKQIDIIAFEDTRYPQRLKLVKPACLVLYVKGIIPKEIDGFSIAVVGSRKPTDYGNFCAKYIAQELCESGAVIVSGMAEGIDGQAQRQVLECGGKTVAVLGSSADYPYPYINRDLYTKLCENGAVISEYPPVTKPFRQNFPQRNRIIAGLSAGTVVVQAEEISGALITASLTVEQGKEVFALPGDITRPQSAGTNLLIKDGAAMVTCAQDILDFYEGIYSMKEKKPVAKQNDAEIDSDEKRIISFLSDTPIHMSELAEISQMDIAQLSTLIIELEMMGKVICMTGGFVKLGYEL